MQERSYILLELERCESVPGYNTVTTQGWFYIIGCPDGTQIKGWTFGKVKQKVIEILNKKIKELQKGSVSNFRLKKDSVKNIIRKV